MIHDYSVKLKDIIVEEPKYMVRRAELKIGTSISIDENMKILRTPLKSLDLKLHEVYLELNEGKIKRIDSDNREKDKFISYLNKKMRNDKVNVVVTNVVFYGSPSQELLEEVLEFFLDIICSNIFTRLVTPPKLIIKESFKGKEIVDGDLNKQYFLDFLKLMKGQSVAVKPLYFIPSYTSRKTLPDLMKLYIDAFGPDGIFVIDMNRGRFTNGGYVTVAQIIRLMRTEYRHEDYGIYLFNHKPRKKSGKEVPSEDLIAVLSGTNLIGNLHSNIPLPPRVLEIMKEETAEKTKILNDVDFLYYPLDRAPNKADFTKFLTKEIGVGSSSFRFYHVNLYNDLITNIAIRQLKAEDVIRIKLSSLKREEFVKELYISSRRVFDILKNKDLSNAF
ncbi:hypothetical protein [Thermofilum sp.]|uniref:hypothetical protein n=1 Tax=Thermofilum sp. TaxID=1961369 RepID=UPI0031677C6E